MKKLLIAVAMLVFIGCGEKKEEVKYGLYKFPYCDTPKSIKSVVYHDSICIHGDSSIRVEGNNSHTLVIVKGDTILNK